MHIRLVSRTSLQVINGEEERASDMQNHCFREDAFDLPSANLTFLPKELGRAFLRRRPVAAHTGNADPTVNPIAKNHPILRRRLGTLHMNLTQRDILTHRRRTAHQTRDIRPVRATAHAREVAERDVGDVDGGGELRALGGLDVEVTLVEHDGPVDVVDVEVDVGDVVDVAVADVFAGPGFEAGAVLWRRGNGCQCFCRPQR